MHVNLSIYSKVKWLQLLETLKINLERHSIIVKEAREGYVEKAKQVLSKRLEELKSGLLVSLQFKLTPPTDYSEIYKTAIQMLEWNTEEYINLSANEFRQLVQDKWDWQTQFLTSNMRYSKTATDWLNEATGGAMVAPPEDE